MTQESTTTKEYVVEISFMHMQPVETAVIMLGNSPEEVEEVVKKLFHKRQDLVIASIKEKPRGYREEATTQEVTQEAMENNLLAFPTKKDMN